MGTRALIHIHDDRDPKTIICTIYRQYDGYLEGLGKQLANFVADREIVNGYQPDKHTKENAANGMSCLAAQLVGHLKEDIGNVYLYPPGISDVGEEFVYHVFKDHITASDTYGEGTMLYEGPASEFTIPTVDSDA